MGLLNWCENLVQIFKGQMMMMSLPSCLSMVTLDWLRMWLANRNFVLNIWPCKHSDIPCSDNQASMSKWLRFDTWFMEKANYFWATFSRPLPYAGDRRAILNKAALLSNVLPNPPARLSRFQSSVRLRAELQLRLGHIIVLYPTTKTPSPKDFSSLIKPVTFCQDHLYVRFFFF